MPDKKQSYELHFSPLQGYTDRIYRNAFGQHFGNVDTFYSPFVRVENDGTFRNKDLRDIDPAMNTVSKLIPQILPGTREEFRLLCGLLLTKGYKVADINLGCPFPMIAGKKKGAGMLPFPEQVSEVLETLNEYPEIRFSAKIRLGWNDARECMNILDILNNLRLEHITIHPRLGKQQYKGETDLVAFRQFYESCKRPLFYNGDLRTMGDIENILSDFPLLRGVSIGRGILSSPLLVKEFYKNETFSDEFRMSLFFNFHQTLFEDYTEVLQGENQLLMKMKTLWDYFLPETDRKLLKHIKKASKIVQYKECVKQIFKR